MKIYDRPEVTCFVRDGAIVFEFQLGVDGAVRCLLSPEQALGQGERLARLAKEMLSRRMGPIFKG